MSHNFFLHLFFFKDGEKADLSPAVYDNIHVLTGALKLYLRLLPIPLVTYDIHPILIKALSKLKTILLFISVF